MNSDSWIVIAIIVMGVMFAGDPDIVDGIIHRLMSCS